MKKQAKANKKNPKLPNSLKVKKANSKTDSFPIVGLGVSAGAWGLIKYVR
jgi:hypothetical protein